MDLSGLMNGIANAANKLLTLSAGVEGTVHTLESTSPLVAGAITLAEQEVGAFPAVAQSEAIFNAVLGLAQVIASATSQAASTAVPKPAGAT